MGAMIALALLLATLEPDEDIADRVVRCGVDLARVSVEEIGISPDGPFSEIHITMPDSAVTSDHLACLVGLAMAGHMIIFSDDATQSRFDPLDAAAWKKATEIRARDWLASHELLERLPVYDPAWQSVAAFATALETYCHAAPGTLTVTRDGMLLLAAPGGQSAAAAQADFECLFNAATIAGRSTEAYGLVVLGNREGH